MTALQLNEILSEHSLERPLTHQGDTIWIRTKNTETFRVLAPKLRQYLQPLNRYEPRPLQHWKVRTHTKPITMRIFVADSGKVLEAAGQDTEIENLEELLHLVGADNLQIAKNGRESGE